MESLSFGFISDKSAPFYFGGYEIRVFELANRLAHLGHDVRVYTTASRALTTPDGAQFIPSFSGMFQKDSSGKRSLLHSASFSLSLSKNPMGSWTPDYLIVEAIPYLHLHFMRKWVSRLDSTCVLDVSEAWHKYSYFGKHMGWLTSLTISRLLREGISFSEVVAAVSEATAQSLSDYYGVDSRRLMVVPNAIDGERLGTYFKLRNSNGSLFHYDFVNVGRLVGIKRQADFIDALSILKHAYGWKGKAAIVGSGPMMQSLVGRAARKGVSDSVDFLGFISDEEKTRVLSSSRVFVLTSEREGFSIATLEAMGLGLPVIVSRPKESEVSGVSDFVTQGKNGLFFPVGDVQRLAEAMESLFMSDDMQRVYGANAEATSRGYDWRNVASSFASRLRKTRG